MQPVNVPPVYKIYCTEKKLFSKGGTGAWRQRDYTFSKVGKCWTSKGALAGHLAQLPVVPESWVIIEYTMNGANAKSFAEVWPDRFDTRNARITNA